MALKWCTFILAILTMFTGQIILLHIIYIVGYFREANFLQIGLFQLFKGEDFTNCQEHLVIMLFQV